MNEKSCTIEGLYESLRGRLKAFVAARTKDTSIADDIVQDAFLKLSGYCARGKSCTYPKSLLFRIASNLVADHFRLKPHAAEPLTQEHEQVPAAADDSLQQECLECFLPLVNQLPEPYREAVKLADIRQMPHNEVALRMGTSLSGTKSRVQRGRAKLRHILLRVCQIERDRRGKVVQCVCRR